MFYRINGQICPIQPEEITEELLVAGYVTGKELGKLAPQFGFSEADAAACLRGSSNFRSEVSVYENYTFTELRIINAEDASAAHQDCLALFVTRNMFLLVDVEDLDSSTRSKFETAVKRLPATGTTLEKMICAFLETLIVGDTAFLEDYGRSIAELEEDVFHDRAGKTFHLTLLEIKKDLLAMHNYYEHLLDIIEAIDDNDNDLFAAENLFYITNLGNKIRRLKEDTDSLRSALEHLQDAYSSFIDTKMNNSMKIFTVLTSIFFPLTIIVGWYGMNFRYMPELEWKYGYVYVIVLSLVTVIGLVLWGKHKKWF